MRFTFLLHAMVAMLFVGTVPAQGTSIASVRDHDLSSAMCSLHYLVSLIDGDNIEEFNASHFDIYTDKLGRVDRDEVPAFLKQMNHSNGVADDKPIEIGRVAVVYESEKSAAYVVNFRRTLWKLERYTGDDGMLSPIFEEDPHFDVVTTSWLVKFNGNGVDDLREAGELYPLLYKKEAVVEPLPRCLIYPVTIDAKDVE